HVGVAAGLVWLVALLLGATPTVARLAVLVLTPAYALLAGAAPSALRATLMVVAYAGARLLGRAILPMAAVLLAAVVLLLASPSLIADAGFQLTVGITAALVRWTGPLAARLPGPSWLRAAVAVPLIAQAAAAPLVAWHFRTILPGAVLTNLMALPLLLPVLALAMAATLLAPFVAALASQVLALLGVGASLLLGAGGVSRGMMLTAPSLPAWLVAGLLLAGTIALLPGTVARAGAVLWLAALILVPAWWLVRPQASRGRVVLLPVADGLAALVPAGGGPLLVDGGRWRAQACRLLADRPVRRLGAVIASHTDEDHLGGLPAILRSLRVGQLIVPRWMMADSSVVPLLREARRRGIRVVPASRGLVIDSGGDRIQVLWPPPGGLPRRENDRSLVARVTMAHGSVLLTSDISSRIERRLTARRVFLRSNVLIVAHHGSRSSSCTSFLRAAAPDVALIPAGPLNPYHHPHAAVLARLRRLGIPYRYPRRDGLCGAVPGSRRWRPFP
ncbi:MAG: DNA internalization-related competence protein ComEC/Rec2, partial [Acidobacteria bacterium]|nr:DNA internalization-related competence protein ComEC/Rec2 [Acidobacteriota bacterium]